MGFENEPSIGGSGLPLFSLVQETAGLLPKVLVYDRRAGEVRTPVRVALRVSHRHTARGERNGSFRLG